MTTRKFNSFKIANTAANREHCQYLRLTYSVSASGNTITVTIGNGYNFASSASALKKALGF